jgi:hypothetical protein
MSSFADAALFNIVEHCRLHLVELTQKLAKQRI